MKTVRFKVDGMHCVNCAMRLQQLEDTLPGIRTIDASYRKATMTAVYDESVVTIAQIQSAAHELGYTVQLDSV